VRLDFGMRRLSEDLLSDRHEDRLMVRCRGHGADAVIPRRQTPLNRSCQAALPVTRIINALEEHKLSSVRRSRRSQIGAEGLDGYVHVADDVAVFEGLRGGVVGYDRVCEDAGVEVGDLEVYVEVGVCGQGLARGGVGDDGGDHVCGGRDVAHC